ncbi:Signaling protein ykoW [Fusarium austroafricanum]|uniref:Signaling protein ykoW n=1 Tax=Fusarium austroafricanum TaxID=2364996 RepID=A0A8H4KM57_9HYPO|nr:Signaling protein ykoW [Fusarium austroafricanum]
MTAERLLEEYLDQVVPKAYNAGYVALSYLISLVGAASTLELINRRSWFNGISNQTVADTDIISLVLACSAITMGGIAIWSMHFIGNQALILAQGEAELQVAYSAGITVLSFCMPVVFLLAAFYATGISNRITWWRVITAGTLCGSAICGMHYLGNASIKNYECIYETAYIVGAAIIAVVASTVALAMFFIFQSLSASSWWKRTISAIVLAGAVSSMHWCASVGTQYRLVRLGKADGRSRTATTIAVICLSLGACIIIAGSAVLRVRTLKQAALRAQQIELGAIVFDKNGRLLIDSSGVFPTTVVTDFFIGENTKEKFNTAHPQFHWMFQASRNWIGISGLINGIKQHLAQLPHKSRHKDAKKGIQLINDDGKLIEGYEVIFRELFCVAASELSERLNEPLTQIGVLWDEILPKRTVRNQAYLRALEKHRGNQMVELSEASSKASSEVNYLEKGVGPESGIDGRGALMFLVRRLTSDDEVQSLVSAGFRFVDPGQVSRSHFQIHESTEFESKLRDMKDFVDQQVRINSGVHLGLFVVQDTGLSPPQVLVRRDARHLLPSVPLHISSFEECHLELLQDLGGMPVTEVLQRLRTSGAISRSPQQELFAAHLSEAIGSLHGWAHEPLFHDAVLTPSIVRLPFGINGDQADETVMMALRLKISHPVISSSPSCQWVPLSFFKMRQELEQSRQEFIRDLHRNFDPLKLPASRAHNELTSGPSSTLRRLRNAVASADSKVKKASVSVTRPRAPSEEYARSSSTINLCPPGGSEGSNERPPSIETADIQPPPERHYTSHQHRFLNGGIIVFQEVTVQVEAKKAESRNDLAPSWSQDTGSEPSRAQQQELPITHDIELQPFGRGTTDVSVKSRWPNNASRIDHGITTLASFINTLIIESNSPST